MLAGLELNGINSISCTCRAFKTGGNLECANLKSIANLLGKYFIISK